jgi:hypothetical protein
VGGPDVPTPGGSGAHDGVTIRAPAPKYVPTTEGAGAPYARGPVRT